ncbi:glycosyltransferase family 4 protein [Trinickia terrae]|uniref:Glycosyltransferase family 4 protein n=1 Tax=Trinickia terrae TaxID=2571161 RepID=A0A4U1ICL6_9BURK|nr:glycosyltransferase family 4 protein [Trinickia terrae]TKC91185.1 glycosyltransferase family 4 protein [Trinickia terrae]
MRILQLVLAPRLSGAEMLAKGIAIGHQKSGHSVCLASLLPQHGDFELVRGELAAHGVTCLFPRRTYSRIGRLLFLYRAIRQFKPDIIFAHATIPALYVRALPLSVPIVWVMHSGVNDFRDSNMLQRAERLLSSRAKAVIGVSQKNIDEYLMEIGEHPSLIVVPNGVDTSCFVPGKGCAPARKPGGESKQVVQIGRYIREKNQLDTVRAFKRTLDIEPQARLLLCGVIEDRDYYEAVVSLVRELGIGARVDVTGPRSDVAGILCASSAFAMPSSFEAHSISFLEALASGIPVVANAIPAFKFAGSYPCVRLVDTKDADVFGRALADALEQPRAVRPLTGLTLQDTADRYLAIARQVLGVRVGLS